LQVSAPSLPHAVEHATELRLAGLAVLFALGGAALAWLMYQRRPDLPDRIARSLRGLYGLVWNKYYVDEIYAFLVVRPLVRFSDTVLYQVVDVRVIDGLGVNGSAALVRGVAERGLKYLQTGFVQSYVFVMLVGAVVLVGYLLGGF
jgi:NADH-quinone oxidoreductase subunit L